MILFLQQYYKAQCRRLMAGTCACKDASDSVSAAIISDRSRHCLQLKSELCYIDSTNLDRRLEILQEILSVAIFVKNKLFMLLGVGL